MAALGTSFYWTKQNKKTKKRRDSTIFLQELVTYWKIAPLKEVGKSWRKCTKQKIFKGQFN